MIFNGFLRFFGLLGRSWEALGALLRLLGASWERSWKLLARSWVSWVDHGGSWAVLGPSWGRLGSLLGASWGVGSEGLERDVLNLYNGQKKHLVSWSSSPLPPSSHRKWTLPSGAMPDVLGRSPPGVGGVQLSLAC